MKHYTPTKYAKLKGVSRQTVYNWINSGKVKTKTIGGVRFVEEK